jgi:hypothetical protein
MPQIASDVRVTVQCEKRAGGPRFPRAMLRLREDCRRGHLKLLAPTLYVVNLQIPDEDGIAGVGARRGKTSWHNLATRIGARF